MKYKCIRLATDAVVIKEGKVLLVKRIWNPSKNCWALPGGYVEYGEKTEKACLRELVEETSVKGKIVDLVGVYSDPKRDPRGHTVSVAYLVDWLSGNGKSSNETKEVKWFSIKNLPELAFDHSEIIKDALSNNEQKLKMVRHKYDKGKKVIFASQAAVNMCWAKLICKYVIKKGHVPVNYFTSFMHFVNEIADFSTMIDSINSLIVRCNELWAFGEVSEGMWYEIKMSKELGLPVKYFSIQKLPKGVREISENEVKYTREFGRKIKRFKKFVPIHKLNN